MIITAIIDEKMSAFALLSLKVNPFVTGLGQDQKYRSGFYLVFIDLVFIVKTIKTSSILHFARAIFIFVHFVA